MLSFSPLEGISSGEPRRLSHYASTSVDPFDLCMDNTQMLQLHHIWGDETPKAIAMIFVPSRGLTDLINFTKYDLDRSRGFQPAGP
jgi:hypothetical protein